MNYYIVAPNTGATALQYDGGDLLDTIYREWRDYIADARPNTQLTYTRGVTRMLHYLADNGITRPQRADIIAYREYLRQVCKPSTVQNYMVAAKLFFQFAEQSQLYPNISAHIKGVKQENGHKKDYLTTSQVNRVLGSIDRNTTKGKRDYAIIALMVTSGLRTIEVSRANLEDVRTVADFTALFVQGKGRDEKTDYVKVSDTVEAAIRDYLKDRGKTAPQQPLFASTANCNHGDRLSTRTVSGVVKEAFRAVGLDSDRLTAHSLRHTAATLNLLNGGSIQETQQLLRHTNINTTMIYSHALERAKNQSEDRVTAAIFGDH